MVDTVGVVQVLRVGRDLMVHTEGAVASSTVKRHDQNPDSCKVTKENETVRGAIEIEKTDIDVTEKETMKERETGPGEEKGGAAQAQAPVRANEESTTESEIDPASATATSENQDEKENIPNPSASSTHQANAIAEIMLRQDACRRHQGDAPKTRFQCAKIGGDTGRRGRGQEARARQRRREEWIGGRMGRGRGIGTTCGIGK